MKPHLLLADTFTNSLTRLSAQEAKSVKTTVFDLQVDASAPGLQFHRIERSKDPNFWSVRVDRDIRLIIHKTAASLLVCYVDHHDKAYAWAERRRIEAHPKTGAIQIVEVRERVDDTVRYTAPSEAASDSAADLPLFAKLGTDDLLSVGVPVDWLADVQSATEDTFLDIAGHLPGEAAEALLQYADGGRLPAPSAVESIDPYAHPDAQRRIHLVADEDELRQALDYPWDRWGVFLHPSQRAIVDRQYGGPARVSGSAGTGKTVVALHRAVALARANPQAKILLTTFSEPLARELASKVRVLAPETGAIVPRITVGDWTTVARELFQLAFGRRARIVAAGTLSDLIALSAEAAGVRGFTSRFLASEFTNVVDAWGIDSLEAYASVPRLGRRRALGPKQRERLWSVFDRVLDGLRQQDVRTNAQVFRTVAAYYATASAKPFGHVVVDEAQDLGPAELLFLQAIVPVRSDSLFFAGDLGQRIFQHPFSWHALGIDVRGRSATLKVCYRTSRQIRAAADGLLPTMISDTDGNAEERKGTVSLFDGPSPTITVFDSTAAEVIGVTAFLSSAISNEISAREIGIFVRSPEALDRAKTAAAAAGVENDATIALMHLAKGLEFKVVVAMACDDVLLPLASRVAEAADEGELDDIFETERQLLYVACTRARDRLLVCGVAPASEFIRDFAESAKVPMC